jgi:hypothetical protein
VEAQTLTEVCKFRNLVGWLDNTLGGGLGPPLAEMFSMTSVYWRVHCNFKIISHQ